MTFNPQMFQGIASVASLAASVGGAISRVREGQEADRIARAEALQYENRARLTRALGSRQAERLMRANGRLRGRQQLVLAASGFSATDVGSTFMTEELVKESSIQEMLAYAQAEDEARNDDFRAKLRRAQGRDARSTGLMSAGLALVSGVTSWRERFGSPENGGGDEDGGGDPFVPYTYDDPRVDPYHRAP